MSIDGSLKTKGSLVRHRNVLTRAERVAKMVEEERFDFEKDSPVGLPKIPHRKPSVGGKTKKKGPDGEGDAAEGDDKK